MMGDNSHCFCLEIPAQTKLGVQEHCCDGEPNLQPAISWNLFTAHSSDSVVEGLHHPNLNGKNT
jgi:hypothetical protein